MLKTIASNLGAVVTGNSKNELAYLEMIAENTENYQSLDDYVALIGDKITIETGDNVTLKALVIKDGERLAGKTVNFYVEDK